jgi:hypothetical protein
MWFEDFALSCGLKIAINPVVGRLRAILWFEDCALSCGLIITICPLV